MTLAMASFFIHRCYFRGATLQKRYRVFQAQFLMAILVTLLSTHSFAQTVSLNDDLIFSHQMIQTQFKGQPVAENTVIPDNFVDLLTMPFMSSMAPNKQQSSDRNIIITEFENVGVKQRWTAYLEGHSIHDVKYHLFYLSHRDFNKRKHTAIDGRDQFTYSNANSFSLLPGESVIVVTEYRTSHSAASPRLSIEEFDAFRNNHETVLLMVMALIVALGLMGILSLSACLLDKDTICYYFAIISCAYVALWSIQYPLNNYFPWQYYEPITYSLLGTLSIGLCLLSHRFFLLPTWSQTLSFVLKALCIWIGILHLLSLLVSVYGVIYLLNCVAIHIVLLGIAIVSGVRGHFQPGFFIIGLVASLVPLLFMLASKFGWGDQTVCLNETLLWGGVLQTFTFCLAILHKLSKKKQVYQSSVSELEERVDANNQFLRQANQQQRRLINELQIANRTKNLFLANVSHEIRTPLTSIIGFSDSLKQNIVPPGGTIHAYNVINRNAMHLSTIIEDILDLTKIEADKKEIRYSPLLIFPFFEVIKDTFQQRVQDKGINFIIDYVFPIPDVLKADTTHLRQIIINLVGNAIKFTHSGAVKVTIEYRSPYLIIAVIDSGIGISKSAIPNIFLPFSQVNDRSENAYGGTGLGLSICHQLCKALKGSIKVESEIGTGSKFQVKIPFQADENANWITNINDIGSNHEQTSQPCLVNQKHFSGNILLAEDHPDSRDYLRLLLGNMGFSVDTVSDGNLAVQALENKTYDILMFDIQMPNLNGMDALKTIRSRGTVTPAIAITANTMRHEVELYLSKGFNNHIGKPVDANHLASVLESYSTHLSLDDVSDEQDPAPSFIEIQQRFTQSLTDEHSLLTRAFEAEDYDTVKRISHKLKGTAGTFGYPMLGQHAATVEQLISQKSDKQQVKASFDILLSSCLSPQ